MKNPEEILKQATLLEREAHQLRAEQKTQEAFNSFDAAASLYVQAGEHLKAAYCYTSAATCWNIRTGWQPLRNAATRSDLAAHEALKAGHYQYAKERFLEASLLYEKEGDFGHYSACFYGSHQTDSKIQWELFMRGRRNKQDLEQKADLKERFLAFGRWVVNQINRLLWGYGERPFRTFWAATAIIVTSALAYTLSGQIQTQEGIRPISFFDGLYMSLITYTTVGFGDYLPLGWTRLFATLEALLGIFLAPLFLIGLTRRYLRMYR